MADGTSDAPIIFTSSQDVVGEETGAGQWGGLVILGNASSNKCPADGSDCALQVEGAEEGAVFGGSQDDDNSGTLRYVVVKHAGFEIAPDNALNGITFGGVGSGTPVDYLQVHGNADDGIEMFGGTVNFKHVVLTSMQDDSIDWAIVVNATLSKIRTVATLTVVSKQTMMAVTLRQRRCLTRLSRT